MSDDLYAVLGVLPGAEDVVITAAYRALARRYHPDHWAGDEAEAHARMANINDAYAVLGSPAKRAEYDKARASSQQSDFSVGESDDFDQAFQDAIVDVESRWDLACSIFPDLNLIREELTKMSSTLAFAFVIGILESKKFAQGREIAHRLEQEFLRRYFGENPELISYGRLLILKNKKDAAKKLNQYVSVLGNAVAAHRIIEKIAAEFGVIESQNASDQLAHDPLSYLQKHPNFNNARDYCEWFSFTVKTPWFGLFKDSAVEVVGPDGAKFHFATQKDFVTWVIKLLESKSQR